MKGGLRIVFDSAIDRAAWPGVLGGRTAAAGEAWLGPLGLLGRLETELGLAGVVASSAERAGDLARRLESRDGWWRASYEADPIGTCRRLLHDRDALALWGWRGEPAGPRLCELWSATAGARPGLPDRLLAVRAALLAGRAVDIRAVDMMSPIAHMPAAWAALFASLSAAGVQVTEVAPRAAAAQGDLGRARAAPFVPVGDGSLALFRPHGPLAAADEIAASLAATATLEGIVVVGGDAVLDAALARHGVPRLGAAAPPPASAALVRLAIEAAFEPMEPADLHALLCLDPGPVPRRVAVRLAGALARLPGRRWAGWQEAMAAGLARCDDEWRADVERRLAALLTPAAARDAPVAPGEIVRRLRVVAAWARGRADRTPSLATVVRLAAGAARLIEVQARPALSLIELRRLWDDLEGDGEGRLPAEAGLAAVAHPGAVLAPADVIVWWGFTRQRAAPPPRIRLSADEAAALEAAGVRPDPAALVEAEAARWRRPLEMAARALVLVCPTTDEAGEREFPHPLWDELQAAMGDSRAAASLVVTRLALPAAPRRSRPALRALPAPATTARAGVALALREHESPSSLERLLGCSLAWALHYQGRLQPGLSSGPAPPSPPLYGRLAHHILARVFQDGALGAEEAAARAATLVDADLSGLCESLGLPRYQVERAGVKQAIVDSARELGRIVSTAGATVRGVELEGARAVSSLGLFGIADMVLSAPDAILDLKWGKRANHDKLVAGTALQLATYAVLFADGDARPEAAYFILRGQELLGEPGSRLPGVHVPGQRSCADTWRGALASLGERRAELADGVLFAPAADGAEIRDRLEANRLVIAPACQYCALGGICGQGGYL